jgi:hypothetical protein
MDYQPSLPQPAPSVSQALTPDMQGSREAHWTMEGAAEYYWGMFIELLQR